MSVTFTAKEIEELENAISNSTFNRSFSSHKKDVKKFLVAHFKKNKSDTVKIEKVKIEKIDKSPKNKSDKIPKKSPNKTLSEKVGPKDGWKIMDVTSGYEYPTSVYKKDVPIEAAESAYKGIIRKNKLGSEAKFTFTIKKDNRAFRYTYENKNLNAHHGR